MSSDGQISFSRVLLSGAGFFADAYDLFVINIAVDIMSKVSYEESLTTEVKSAIKSMALAGAIVGQLLFGSLADLIGRRRIFITTCVLVIVGAICSSQAQDTKGSFGIYSQIIFWRFILGLRVCRLTVSSYPSMTDTTGSFRHRHRRGVSSQRGDHQRNELL
jgi:PHS family inorganic phosphate transporter-like MFS transporter